MIPESQNLRTNWLFWNLISFPWSGRVGSIVEHRVLASDYMFATPAHSSHVSGTRGTRDGNEGRDSVAAKTRVRRGYTSLERFFDGGNVNPPYSVLWIRYETVDRGTRTLVWDSGSSTCRAYEPWILALASCEKKGRHRYAQEEA
jgi:hypothetical protein